MKRSKLTDAADHRGDQACGDGRIGAGAVPGTGHQSGDVLQVEAGVWRDRWLTLAIEQRDQPLAIR